MEEPNYFDPLMNIKQEPELIINDVIEQTMDSHDENSSESLIENIGRNLEESADLAAGIKCHIHSSDFERYCSICEKDVRNLSFHLSTFHSDVSYDCDLCDFSTKYEANLVTHKNRMHIKTKSFSCSHCSLKFNDQSNKNRHMRMKHPIMNKTVKFECHICLKSVTFGRKDNLNLHLRRIHGIRHKSSDQKNFLCDLCSDNVTFVTKSSLINHMRFVHITNSQTFKCSLCSKLFKSKASLVAHLNSIHLKKFLCRYCNKSLGRETTLAKHEARGKCRN